jgi:hypothetical protein
MGISNFSVEQCLLSLPLWERGGERGPRALSLWLPPSLTLPRKGGGNARNARLTWTR